MKDWFRRAAASVQRLWLSKPIRAVAGRLLVLVLVVALSPQIVAVWRILLAGAPADQGLILIICAVLVFIVGSRRRVRQLKKEDDHGSRKQSRRVAGKPNRSSAAPRAVNRRKGAKRG